VDDDARERFAPTYEVCQLAERLGFDFVATGHHRLIPERDNLSAPTVLLAAIAARTETLRLSSAVFLLALYDPLDMAEQIATLDQVSDGRTMLSFGLGYRPEEYEHAGLVFRQRASRMEECLQIIRQAWTQDEVRFSGNHFQIDGVPVPPAPRQTPHPPLWLGGAATAGVERTARLADGWMADSTLSIDSVVRKATRYRATAAELARPSQICVVRQVGIGPTRRHVEETWLPDMAKQLFGVWKAGGKFPGSDEFGRKMTAGERISLEEFAGDRDVVGTPSEVIEQIRRYRELTRCEYFLGIFGDQPDQRALSEALELFGREVIPQFQ
jgi:probable F420-dependent oxidoreductase